MKLFIGVVSKNTVDAVIEYANEHNVTLGLIPSQNQVDYLGGYAGWTTETLSEYVKERTDKVIIERDHGVGNLVSYQADTLYFDAMHIDPWKISSSITEVVERTICNTEFCYRYNKKLWFEIGTEEAITRMDDVELWEFIHGVKSGLDAEIFERIKYVVIQSGTRLHETSNTGEYDEDRLTKMIGVANEFGLETKIHNGDYLTADEIKHHFDMGVGAVNIAPEFGSMESEEYIVSMKGDSTFDKFYRLCLDSGQWRKWVDNDFDVKRRVKLTLICGHYVFSTDEFKEIKKELDPDIDNIIKHNIKKRIDGILNA